jgi:putative DNA primase/helicase
MSVKKANRLEMVNILMEKNYEKLESLKLDDITNFMLNYLKHENNELIKYVTKKKRFLYYQNGVWKAKDNFYIKKKISRVLCFLNKNSSKDQINKVLNQLAFVTANPLNEELFSNYNQSKNYINFKNGMLNLRTMELESHSPDYFSTFQLPHEYNSKGECPQWKELLKEWLPHDTVSFLQEYMGYLLVPDNREHIIPILYDETTNKSSIFIEVIETLLGYNNVSNIELSNFTYDNRWIANKLEGKLANICSNIEEEHFKSSSLIKIIMGGENVSAEVRFGPIYSYKPVVRFLFSTNKLPVVKKNASYSWYRRLKIVGFSNKLSSDSKDYDQHLIDRLKKELPSIVQWSIEGLMRLRENGEFTKSKQMSKDKNRFIQINAPISIFFDEHYELVNDSEELIPTHLVYAKYRKWAEENGYIVENKMILTQNLVNRDVEVKNKSYQGKICRHYLGIKEKSATIEDELDSVIDLNELEGSIEKNKTVVANNGTKLELFS